MAHLITGRAGSGKSTVCRELKQRGYEAYDADAVPGLAAWIDLKTGRTTDVDYTEYVDYSRVGWNWNTVVLQRFIADHPRAYLCGSASNQLEFHELFNQVFILELGSDVQHRRLQTRASTYAKDPRQIEEIIAEQRKLLKQSVSRGAIAVDANKPPSEIVKDITGSL